MGCRGKPLSDRQPHTTVSTAIIFAEEPQMRGYCTFWLLILTQFILLVSFKGNIVRYLLFNCGANKEMETESRRKRIKNVAFKTMNRLTEWVWRQSVTVKASHQVQIKTNKENLQIVRQQHKQNRTTDDNNTVSSDPSENNVMFLWCHRWAATLSLHRTTHNTHYK